MAIILQNSKGKKRLILIAGLAALVLAVGFIFSQTSMVSRFRQALTSFVTPTLTPSVQFVIPEQNQKVGSEPITVVAAVSMERFTYSINLNGVSLAVDGINKGFMTYKRYTDIERVRINYFLMNVPPLSRGFHNIAVRAPVTKSGSATPQIYTAEVRIEVIE